MLFYQTFLRTLTSPDRQLPENWQDPSEAAASKARDSFLNFFFKWLLWLLKKIEKIFCSLIGNYTPKCLFYIFIALKLGLYKMSFLHIWPQKILFVVSSVFFLLLDSARFGAYNSSKQCLSFRTNHFCPKITLLPIDLDPIFYSPGSLHDIS